jgi:hypothetical protein
MNVHGEHRGFIQVDTDKLASGVYSMVLEDHINTTALTLGMLPYPIMQALENGLKERVPDKFYFAGDPLVEHDGKAFRNKVLHEVTVKVLKLAKKGGILCM